jgi:8-oxo-dGTP diphosphatase
MKIMQRYNLIMVYSPDKNRLLLCKRTKDPYKGLLNLPGGKVENGEDGLAAAYRELFEETGITREDIAIKRVMDFVYYNQDCAVEVYAGRLKADVTIREEANPLLWSGLDEDFFDCGKYAGEGNIGHMVLQLKVYGGGYLE